MKILLLILMLVVMQTSCVAQDSTFATFKYTGKEFSRAVNKRIVVSENHLSGYVTRHLLDTFRHVKDSFCTAGVALVKFRFSPTKSMTDVACSTATSPFLANHYKIALMKSSKYWRVPRGSDLYYILPIYYSHKFDCDSKEIKPIAFGAEDIFLFDDGMQLVNEYCRILQPVTYEIRQADRGANALRKK
jgi:hypothetical protein